MVVLFFNETKRMAVVKLSGSAELIFSRAKADGSTVGVRANGFNYGSAPFKTLDTQELLDALTYVMRTDAELIESGMPEAEVKPKIKRNRKAERERREAKKKAFDEEEDVFF